MTYPKRLIEVDLPIRRISAHARREKSIRHGHISTLHIWWARRPLAACRAVICASLWPDPADENCPQAFRDAAVKHMLAFAKASQSNKDVAEICDAESWKRYKLLGEGKLLDLGKAKDLEKLRSYLLDFIADFAAWEASTNHSFLETARSMTQAAHEALGGDKGTRPLVVDPFAGGGAIPLEALRVGADAFASDLNPVAVLLNKVVLEYIPNYGQRLADEVRKWGLWIKEQAEKELEPFYPKGADGSIPIAYLWARTITCEGPSCGAEVPLMRSLWLEKRGKRSTSAVLSVTADKFISVEVQAGPPVGRSKGTIIGGAVTCPVCGYTTPVESVRSQMTVKRGGARDARLTAVVYNKPAQQGQFFRAATATDVEIYAAAVRAFDHLRQQRVDGLPPIPDGKINHLRGFFNIVLYGMTEWGDLFSPRQALSISTLSRLVRDLPSQLADLRDDGFATAIQTVLALVVDRVAVRCTSNCIWDATTGCIMQVFNQGQALPARWEFAEMSPCLDTGSGWATSIEYTLKVIEHVSNIQRPGTVEQASALQHSLPDDSVDYICTDPPYYAAIPYADLSDFFYSWLRRSLSGKHKSILTGSLSPKDEELVSLSHRAAMYREKDNAWFESKMQRACEEARRICRPSGIGVFVFANKETAAWEAMLAALIGAGWVVTSSWPVDTESGNRLRAKDSAALVSSVHLVCRPREDVDGRLSENEVGDWREVLTELPVRTKEWMARLSSEGVVGADAIFACLGPALEIFSRYSRVEKASGEPVLLKEYLTYVWGAVAQEALAQIFTDADATGFEEDARLTAMWLWTLNAGGGSDTGESESVPEIGEADVPDEGNEGDDESKSTNGGYALEFDAARKIAQGLGAHLEQMSDVVEVKSGKARLLSVGERTRKLFGKEEADAPKPKGRKKAKQLSLGFMQEIEAAEADGNWGDKSVPKLGDTVLDRIHQSMILFAAGRGEALRRFLVEDGAGQDQRFWKLANALSALYPQGTDEKRWVDGVLARKKGLGL